ncbi:hypothetical protein F5884DRAFT_858993 [Xylogone sp. PMI_703]|nr:hypothetical protein F5884DRAFT_858993 [Xylogone sp. PMI_703]
MLKLRLVSQLLPQLLTWAGISSANIPSVPRDLISNALGGLETHNQGMLHLADDGVLRSYDADRYTVIAYKKLAPEEIAAFTAEYTGADKEHLDDVFNGVDGRLVSDESKLLNPDSALRPNFGPGDPLASRDLEARYSICGSGCGIAADCPGDGGCTYCLYIDQLSLKYGEGHCYKQ